MFNKSAFISLAFILSSLVVFAQKDPLSQGVWVKIGVSEEGVYQLSASQIQNMGFILPMKSNHIQLFGLNDSTFIEKVPSKVSIDFKEIAIKVVDGGDGIFDNNDYLLFYHSGNRKHQFDVDTKTWNTITSLQSDTSFYYITINNLGKRVVSAPNINNIKTTSSVTTYTHHYYFETDSVSLINSGKLWLGQPMGLGIGKTNVQQFNINTQGVQWAQPIQINFDFWATNYQNTAQFNLLLNNIAVDSFRINNVTGYIYDATALNNLGARQYLLPIVNTSISTPIQIQYQGGVNSTGWINYLGIHAKRTIGFYENNQIPFFVQEGKNNDTLQVVIDNANANTFVWKIDLQNNPSEIATSLNGTTLQFNVLGGQGHYFVATKSNEFRKSWIVEKMATQQLDQLIGADYVIITPPLFEKSAQQLANFYTNVKHWYNAKVVLSNQIYNVFGLGQIHAIAIRNFLKYLKTQANLQGVNVPRYVLLMGGGNFDNKHLLPNLQLPVYESMNSNEILNSYTSDDFFACLENGQDLNTPSSIDSLSLAIGRLPIRTINEADSIVNKLIRYQSSDNMGDWKRDLIWIADDGDYNLHLQDADAISNNINSIDPIWNHKKMYLDLYNAVSTSTGNTYPTLVNDLKQRINNGALLLNYTGHGNYLRLSEEAVISATTMSAWKNPIRNPIMVTASCDFGPLDQPQLKPIAWDALMQSSNGIIGLVAASRLVFAYSNKQINDYFAQQLLLKQKGVYQTIGEALQNAKKWNWKSQGDKINAFKFNLIGDPAMRLPINSDTIREIKINQKFFNGTDTLQAGTKITVEGAVFAATDSGTIHLVVYDQPKTKNTLANQNTSIVTPITLQEDIIYKGTATFTKGVFKIEFVMPKEIVSLDQSIKMECYANNGVQEAWWSSNHLFVKSNEQFSNRDTVGPTIMAYIRNKNFKTNQQWTMGNEPLYIFLKDSSGIQSTGSVLGHDIELYIDQNTTPYILNQLYVSDLNTYQSGSIAFNLPLLEKGKHRITIRAWDLVGNESKDSLFFYTPDSTTTFIKALNIIPNPIQNNSKVTFDLSFIPQSDEITLSIVDVYGNLIFSHTAQISASSNFVEIPFEQWGFHSMSLTPGVYFCKVQVMHENRAYVLTNKLIKMQ